MSIKLQLPNITELKPRITVVGIGGAGGNAVDNMIASGLAGVDFVVANTDAQALATSSAEHCIQLGINLTEGLGAGSRPEIGEAAAEEAMDEIRSQLSGSHMVFVAAGMGGGTGTGAASVIARLAHEQGILTVGVVTKPFHFEGNRRMRSAEAGITELAKHVDTLIVIPNQNLFRIANKDTTFAEAFVLADQVLHAGISCITDLMVREGLINLDFADVRAIMLNMGAAMMGTGEAEGENRAKDAAEIAIANPLLDNVSLKGAKGLLISISGTRDMTLYEVDEAASRIREEADPEANIILGASFDDNLDEKIRVSIVASGLAEGAENGRVRGHATSPEVAAQLDREMARDSGEVARRLSDAITAGIAGAAPPAVSGTGDGDPVGGPGVGGDDWGDGTFDGGDEVTIELGPPQLLPADGPGAGDQNAAPALTSASNQLTSDPFSPAAPESIKTPASRMPELGEFPAVGQKDYRASQDPAGGPGEPVVRRRRASLFDRLTGRATDTVDSRDSRHEGRHAEPRNPTPRHADGSGDAFEPHHTADAGTPRPTAHEDNRIAATVRQRPAGTSEEGAQDTELPKLFRTRERR